MTTGNILILIWIFFIALSILSRTNRQLFKSFVRKVVDVHIALVVGVGVMFLAASFWLEVLGESHRLAILLLAGLPTATFMAAVIACRPSKHVFPNLVAEA